MVRKPTLKEDEYGKIIDIDFEKGGVNLTYEYLKRSKDIEDLKALFRDSLRLIDKTASDKAYTRNVLFQFWDIIKDVEKKRDKEFDKRRE